MAKFNFRPLVGDADKISTALGVNAAGKFTDQDLNKFVKLGPNSNHILCNTGDDIEGLTLAIAPNTVNDGFSFGTVQDGGHIEAKIGLGTLVVGATVVAGVQAALGTAQDYPVIVAGAGVLFKYRVVDLLGNGGTVGTICVIKKLD